jgi:hypothetical protein
METAIYWLALLIALPVLYPLVRVTAAVYRRYRGTRLITCPETRQPAAVKVDAAGAVFTALAGHATLELKDCTRWPEKRNCGQECLRQIEAAPENCLVRNILAAWYRDKACVFCRKPLGEMHWLEHKPAVLGPEGRTREWSEIPAPEIPDVLATHQPVCWDCHMAETFRRQFPELVTERPEHKEAETGEVHEIHSGR